MEDDMEEMKALRESRKEEIVVKDEGGSSTASGTDASKKKPRTFDFMSMFQEARNTAIQRSQDNMNAESIIAEEEVKFKKMVKKEESSSSSSDSDSSSDDETIGPPLPPGMSKSSHDDDDDMVGPPLPPEMRKKTKYDSDEDDSEEEEDTPESKIPSSHEIILNHGDKPVSALALDPSGARLVTGGVDFDIKFWDFAGMDGSLQSFRSIRPCECHQIKQLQYSATGDTILVVAGNAKAKILDRDGFEKMECMKGDPYITDMANTKGHTAMLNAGAWHPKIREEFMTCSNDGTVRLWDLNMEGKKHKHVLKPRSQQGRRTIPTACAYSKDGRWIATACQDGSIQMWDHNKSFVNITMTNRNAHMNGSDTSCLCFSYDGQVLASRGGDDTLKLWDMRNFKKPLHVEEGLISFYPFTDCIFSPDDQLIVTGTSVKKNQGKGKLLFFDRSTFNRVTEIEASDSSVVRCLWHPKLNQMVIGCSDGQVKLFYDPTKSHRGAMLSIVKKERKSKQVKVMASQQIITPYALPMFREARPTSTKKFEERVRKDPVKSRRPDLPVTGPGEGGRLANKGATLSQYVVQSLATRKPDKYENDPRAAILRHAKEAKENPFWIDPAYKKNQPVPIFQKQEEEKEKDEHPLFKKPKTS